VKHLVKSDPSNAGWQRDLSVSYNKIGDVLVAQRNLAEALKSYQAGLAIIERLMESNPGRPAGKVCYLNLAVAFGPRNHGTAHERVA
jgi:hypothetical protein